jgi:ferredoxin-thioredoxin reductase catalytic chain
MSEMDGLPSPKRVDALLEQLDKEAEAGGYHLNPNEEHTRDLVEALIINEERYGYPACPCRLSDGDKQEDLDIVCPCDYRDPDLSDFGACYCALYVSDEIKAGEKEAESIPERRPDEPEERPQFAKAVPALSSGLTVWRCRVCGYLCAREQPPGRCPVCKATKERFEPLRLTVGVG